MPILLLILAAAWCAYLAFWWRDSRRAALAAAPDSLDRIESFKAGMNTLANSALAGSVRSSGQSRAPIVVSPVALPIPRSPLAAAQRRHQVTLVLCAAAVVTLLLAMFLGWMAVLAHLAVDAALAVYSYGCVRRRNLAAEREIKVRMLYPESHYPEGVVPLHPAGLPSDQPVLVAAGSARMQTG